MKASMRLITFVSILIPCHLTAQNSEWVQQARRYMSTAAGIHIPDDYLMTRVRTGSLGDGEAIEVVVELESNTSYRFLGACDDDCGDLDMELRNSNGEVVAQDLQNDDIPLLGVRVGDGGGAYRVRLVMHNCKNNPCAWAMGTYSR
jgi:hypothetical protein